MPNATWIQPGGAPPPYAESPPTAPAAGGIVGAYLPPFNFGSGQLPGEGAGPGDTQVGYPTAPSAPVSLPASFANGTPLVIRYCEAGATPISANDAFDAPPIRAYLGDGAAGPCVASSLRFTFRGRTYVDRAGALYYGIDPLTNAGTLGGNFDYQTNVATITDYGSGSNTILIVSMATRYVEPGVDGVMFRTPGAPLRPGSFTVRATTMAGTLLTGTVDINGDITGTYIKGHVDWQIGLSRVAFGSLVTAAGNEAEPWYNADLIDGSGKIWKPVQVDPSSVFFGTVIFQSVPVNPDLIGIDPVRMPSNGLVPGLNPGTVAIVSHTQLTIVVSPVAAHVHDLGRERISFIEVLDALKVPIDSVWYAIDMDAGTLTWSDPLNLSAYTMPVTIRDRIQDVRQITDVQITGEITLAAPITHDYPAGAIISNGILYDDTQSRYADLFDQQTYQAGVWSDIVDGSPAGGTYNDATFPLLVSNDACLDQRWVIRFRSTTTVDVIGEFVGQILSGASITSDISPINPVTQTIGDPTGKPYFTIDKDGWGGGWAADNIVRFNTISATIPPWLARVVTPGTIEVANDEVRIQVYGNAH